MDAKKILTNPTSIILIALLCCILWGSAFPVLKTTYRELQLQPDDLTERILLAGVRFFLASLMLFTLVGVLLKQNIRVAIKFIPRLILLGVLQTTLQYIFFYTGLAHTSGMKGAILSSIGTFFVVILAHFFYKNDRLNWRKTIGLCFGFAGIILVNWGKDFNLEFSLLGEGFIIFSGITSAFGTILAKQLAKELHPFLVTAWQMFMGASLLIILGLPGTQIADVTLTPKFLILLIYSSLLSAIAFSLWYSLLKYSKAGVIAIYRFMIPVSGAILSVIFLPEDQFSLKIIGALVLVSLGIIVVNRKKRAPQLDQIKSN